MAGHIATAGSASWCTPPEILDVVREAFGGEIGLDPCSNPEATVGALIDYTLPFDGLAADWDAKSVFVNPPYGVTYLHKTTMECVGAKEFRARKESANFEPDDWKKQTIADWVKKTWEESKMRRQDSVMLIPAAVDTKHWQDIIFPYATVVCFIRGRVHFYENGQRGGPAPMACALVGFGPFEDCYGKYTFDVFKTLGFSEH